MGCPNHMETKLAKQQEMKASIILWQNVVNAAISLTMIY